MVKYITKILWNMAKRLVSMDIMRGWAILLMVIFHIFLNISDILNKLGDLSNVPIIELIIIAFVGKFSKGNV